ncbi:MAG TPA: flagellar hook capping FlgD N-terminal domain-containing protein [Solirubrobacteraceae bacterium]|nr:flagellar hook capping FlgD N-terminal domain-containing protein [Solirubrobacteraceae bacterium]
MSTPTTPVSTAPSPVTNQSGKASSTKVENAGGELDKNDFLKLMVAQLQAQNPMEPTSDTEYTAELAQFSQLEQTTNIAQTSSELVGSQKIAQAVALIGHTVSYLDASTGATVEGKVQKVDITSSGASLTVEGVGGIEPAAVSEVS